jgi:hypothetical protein
LIDLGGRMWSIIDDKFFALPSLQTQLFSLP